VLRKQGDTKYQPFVGKTLSSRKLVVSIIGRTNNKEETCAEAKEEEKQGNFWQDK